ncbi:MAG: DUF2834 domain-containing protein [Gammaproteobacteria bacterium]|nr:DUF2834 domain-containing protein [Gammaproteobacteria bacterium]
MNQKYTYIALCVLGIALPMSQFIPWLLAHGLDASLFISELFSTSIGGFFGLDVMVSALALFTFIYYDGKKYSIRNLWVPVIATLSIGVSLGLPLYLYMRYENNNR